MQTNTKKKKKIPWNHLHLKIFYNIKCFTSKQTKPKSEQSDVAY